MTNNNNQNGWLTEQEIYTIINWYQQVECVNPNFLNDDDKAIYRKLFIVLKEMNGSISCL